MVAIELELSNKDALRGHSRFKAEKQPKTAGCAWRRVDAARPVKSAWCMEAADRRKKTPSLHTHLNTNRIPPRYHARCRTIDRRSP